MSRPVREGQRVGRAAASAAMCVAAAFAMAACDDGPSPRPAPTPGEERITGRERLGWDQAAADAAELATFRYAVYVDGSRSEMIGVSCTARDGQQAFVCTAPLPTMPEGVHTLAVAAFVVDSGGIAESATSAPLRVVVVPAGPASAAVSGTDTAATATSEGVRLRAEIVAAGLSDPRDLAFAPDGSVFIAERGGTIRALRQAQLHPGAARVPDDVATEGEGGLLTLALDPRFDRTNHVYLVYTTHPPRGGLAFRLARFRYLDGTLAERAVLLDEVPASRQRPSAWLRFGPDEKLYVAFDDGGDERAASDRTTYGGKILRLDPDGTTPADQPSGSPILADGLRRPRGFDWRGGTLWVADEGPHGAERLLSMGSSSGRAATRVSYALPQGSGAAAVAAYRGALIPAFRGDLLIAASEGGHILRMRFDASTGASIIGAERLLWHRGDSVRNVATTDRGDIFFFTSTALFRVVPE